MTHVCQYDIFIYLSLWKTKNVTLTLVMLYFHISIVLCHFVICQHVCQIYIQWVHNNLNVTETVTCHWHQFYLKCWLTLERQWLWVEKIFIKSEKNLSKCQISKWRMKNAHKVRVKDLRSEIKSVNARDYELLNLSLSLWQLSFVIFFIENDITSVNV